jgi:MYXO-CTERM domain-containing protein
MGGLTINIAGLSSNGFQNGTDGNVTIATGLSGITILSISYNINASGVGVSWFEEMTYSLWDGEVGGALIADGSNGALSYAPGSQTSFFVNASAAGTHDIADTASAGEIIIELHEWSFDDVVGPDAFYNDGSTLTINYFIPAPAGLAVLGLFGLVRRRRR